MSTWEIQAGAPTNQRAGSKHFDSEPPVRIRISSLCNTAWQLGLYLVYEKLELLHYLQKGFRVLAAINQAQTSVLALHRGFFAAFSVM